MAFHTSACPARQSFCILLSYEVLGRRDNGASLQYSFLFLAFARWLVYERATARSATKALLAGLDGLIFALNLYNRFETPARGDPEIETELLSLLAMSSTKQHLE